MTDLIAWLNTNSGAVNALSASLSAVFAAAAALAAFISIRRAWRRERCNIDVYVNTTMHEFNPGQSHAPSVQFSAHNLGPATPLFATYDFDRMLGDSIKSPLEPGTDEVLTVQPVTRCREWCRVRISWLEPNGKKRRIRFWYRVEGPWDARENARKYVRVDRDERATYFPRPMYLRRRPPIQGYIDWRVRKHKERQLQKSQALWAQARKTPLS